MSQPFVLVPNSKETKAFDISSLLLQQRKVFYVDEVSSSSANQLIQQLLWLESVDAKAPITLYINSPGGSIVDGMGIYDVIRGLSCPVHAVVTGMAASMGAIILSGCTKGQRAIMPHGEVLLHQPLGGAQGPASDIAINAKRIIAMKEMLLKILAQNCNQPYEKLIEDCDRDYWLDPKEAVAYGICDKIL